MGIFWGDPLLQLYNWLVGNCYQLVTVISYQSYVLGRFEVNSSVNVTSGKRIGFPHEQPSSLHHIFIGLAS